MQSPGGPWKTSDNVQVGEEERHGRRGISHPGKLRRPMERSIGFIGFNPLVQAPKSHVLYFIVGLMVLMETQINSCTLDGKSLLVIGRVEAPFSERLIY